MDPNRNAGSQQYGGATTERQAGNTAGYGAADWKIPQKDLAVFHGLPPTEREQILTLVKDTVMAVCYRLVGSGNLARFQKTEAIEPFVNEALGEIYPTSITQGSSILTATGGPAGR